MRLRLCFILWEVFDIKTEHIDLLGCNELYQHMKRDFPPKERPNFFALLRNMRTEVYDTYYVTDDNDERLAYFVVTAPEDNAFAFVPFFAVLPEFRSKGIGGKALAVIKSMYPDRNLILEIEDPEWAESDERKTEMERRKRFYERNGFTVLKTRRAIIFGVDMLLMTDAVDFKGSVKEVMHSLYRPAFGTKRYLKKIQIVE